MRRLAVALLAAASLGTAVPGGAAAGALPEGEAVLGVSFRGTSRAYPLSAFDARPVLNDVVARQEIVLFHDPCGGVATAWFSTVFGEPIRFSGEAAGTVADDISTITRWDLATGEAVAGNLLGQRLIRLPVKETTWGSWREAHPEAEVYAAAP